MKLFKVKIYFCFISFYNCQKVILKLGESLSWFNILKNLEKLFLIMKKKILNWWWNGIRWIPNTTRVKELWVKDKIFYLDGKPKNPLNGEPEKDW